MVNWREPFAGIGLALLIAASPACAESARTLYYLNCIGCHPLPASDSSLGAPKRAVGGFYQTEAGRRFFIRVPPRSSAPMSASDEALLLDELLTWKTACLALTPATALIRQRPRGLVQ
ncbi:MAG: hypothetical protein WCH44_13145 [Betaproteobacteria bacterium]